MGDRNRELRQIDPLLSLRGLACLIVIIGHCAPAKHTIYYQNYDLTWLIFGAGGVAVRIFFCLSGYLMGKAFYTERYTEDAKGFINFWRNRVLRIFPLYYFAVLILGSLFYPHIWKLENWSYLVRLLTFTYNHALPIEFNGALWTLSTEVQFYLLVPFVYSYLKPHLVNYRQILWSFVGIIAVSFILRQGIWLAITWQKTIPVEEEVSYFIKYIYTPLFTNLDTFLCGFLINPLLQLVKGDRQNLPQRTQKYIKLFKNRLAWLTILILYLVTAYCKYYNQALLVFISPSLTALLTSVFIFLVEYTAACSQMNYSLCAEIPDFSKKSGISVPHSPEKRCNSEDKFINSNKIRYSSLLVNTLLIMEILGKLSYGMYIWHVPIISNINPLLNSHSPLVAFILKFIATLTVSTLLASVTYYLIEVPAAKWKNYCKS